MPITIDGRTYAEGLTHPGTFHADDVFATALLRIVAPNLPIRRDTPDTAARDTLVYDQGGGEFDHHGMDAKARPDGTAYSSFGLLWERLGKTLCHPDDARMLDDTFVRPIDDADNHGTPYVVAIMVNDILGEHDDLDEGFWCAVDFAHGILSRRIASVNEAREGAEEVEAEVTRQGDPEVLVLDEWRAGWQRVARSHSTLFCVFPSSRGGWSAQGVPADPTSGRTLVPYPKPWLAKRDAELAEASGVADATFCHRDAFLACAGSKEGAIELARRAIVLYRMDRHAESGSAGVPRRATVADIPALREARKLQLIDEGMAPDADIDGELDAYLAEGLSDGTLLEWVIEEDGEIVATAALALMPFPPTFTNPQGTRGYITNMYTVPSHRGRCIATRMLSLIIDEARRRGLRKLILHASVMGRPIYQRIGFIDGIDWMAMNL